MDFHASRLRRGEVLAGAGAVLLVVFLLAGPWAGSRSGWELLVSLRWLLALTIAAAFGLVLAQASRRAPAVPVTMSLLVTVLGAISALALIYRVLINPPAHQHAAAYLGLLSAIGLAYGGYLSMRKEGIADRDAPQDIPVVRPRRENGS
ncbi:MAG: hypothetical protein JOY56_01410 [Solirubrobacterales bacterium]|nr:hypothetical protein [Solirubrobacterales bacterium]MBV9807027.1 hypothetical protein [Solirubrobacterales bacterium]